MTQMLTGLDGMTHLCPEQVFNCRMDGHSYQPDRADFEEALLLGRHNTID